MALTPCGITKSGDIVHLNHLWVFCFHDMKLGLEACQDQGGKTFLDQLKRGKCLDLNFPSCSHQNNRTGVSLVSSISMGNIGLVIVGQYVWLSPPLLHFNYPSLSHLHMWIHQKEKMCLMLRTEEKRLPKKRSKRREKERFGEVERNKKINLICLCSLHQEGGEEGVRRRLG